ncbi:unnamed protein product [Arabidopsis halleri]
MNHKLLFVDISKSDGRRFVKIQDQMEDDVNSSWAEGSGQPVTTGNLSHWNRKVTAMSTYLQLSDQFTRLRKSKFVKSQ